MRRPLTLLFAAGLTLAGCDMAPKYARPALPVPPSTPQGDSYAPAVAAAVSADTAWQSFFTDPRLQGVIRAALANNRDLRVSVANVAQARAQYRVQRADLFPTIGLSGSATYQRSPFGATATTPGTTSSSGSGTGATGAAGGTSATGATGSTTGTTISGSGTYDIYQLGGGISAWEIDLFGRVRDLTKAAQEQFFAAAENRDAAQVSLVAETATAWLTLAADQDRLRLAKNTAETYGRTLDLTKARFDRGVASQLEVHQAQTTYDQARSDIANATTLVAQDLNALTLLAGTTLTADQLPDGLGTGNATLDTLPGDLPSAVLLNRPDVLSAEHQLLSANANIGAARAAFFPQISLTAAAGTLSLGLSNLFGNGSGFWSVAPSATIPIFDFGRNKGNLRYAEATRDAMVATYEKSVQTAFRETADALARRGTIDAQIAAQQSLRDNAAGYYKLSQARFQSGIDPFLTTLDAQRQLYTAEQTLLAVRLTRQTNAVALYQALGGGLK